MFSSLIIIIYTFAVGLIILYTIAQFSIFLSFLFKKNQLEVNNLDDKELPFVTVQLPIYNEKYVVERLLECITQLNYPKEKIEIQVLDDSTDESLAMNIQLVNKYKSQGIDIVHIHRTDRVNYKAGALKFGLETAKGSLIAIFDADFLPETNWLYSTIHYFNNLEVGVVQARWKHINRDYSILTYVQGMALDYHFVVEQSGRNKANHFINFNGTAGIWRKECIYDAGNWEGDTLTEDLDLSYRAQLKNWKFVYLENLETPSELPVTMSAVRTQQFRWNKGGAENFRKNIKLVFNSENISFLTKIQALAHLLNSSVFLCAFIVSIFSVGVLWVEQYYSPMNILLNIGTIIKFNIVFLFIVFYFTFRKVQSTKIKDFPKFCFQFMVFFPVILGLTFHNSLAVLEGYFNIKSEFIRTPKFNIQNNTDSWKGNKYLEKKISFVNYIEIFLVGYFSFGIFLAFYLQNYAFLAFHILLVLGYVTVIYKTLDE